MQSQQPLADRPRPAPGRPVHPHVVAIHGVAVKQYSDGTLSAHSYHLDFPTKQMITSGLSQPAPVGGCVAPVWHQVAEAAVEALQDSHDGQLELW